MRDYFAARLRWLRVNWLLPLALLMLPACGLPTSGGCIDCGCDNCADEGGPNLDPGPEPLDNAVFCDIETPGGRTCASDALIADPDVVRLSQGAEALVVSLGSSIALDYSADALARCGGKPEAVEFYNNFPDGTPICVNCSAVATTSTDATKLCIAQCEDFSSEGAPVDSNLEADCTKRSHLSINAATPKFCFEGACADAGEFLNTWGNRRDPEAVTWQGLTSNMTANDNTLTKNATGTDTFDAGAASNETITTGDGYVEFTASGLTTRMIGLSAGDVDLDSGYTTIDYGLDLFKDGCVYVFEKGVQKPGPLKLGDAGNPCTVDGAWLTYQDGDKFRVSVTDTKDGSGFGVIGYVQVTPSCTTSLDCPSFYDSASLAAYSSHLRVDTSFHDDNAKIENIVLVRIRQ
jgi:hypothetical protein